jgi:hypothetical protein
MKSIHLYFLVSILLFSSCHSLVEDELPAMKSTPVINSILKVDSVFKVHVSLTANLGDSVPKPVANALVVIRSSTDTPDTLLYTQKGWYVSSRVVKANTYYSCLADIPGCPQVSAQTYVPQASEITRVVFKVVGG